MYGDYFLLEGDDGRLRRAPRLALGDTGGRDERWLRDLLFANPELIPIGDIEPGFGPLLPLCTELNTPAGYIDIAFINPAGKLTLVECKLWRNAEARRKVVAQILNYARAIKSWTYADLQRQTSIATKRRENVPYAVAKAVVPTLQEHRFSDAVSRAMREGRFLLLVAGDGIREDVSGIADLINRNATSGFSLGLLGVALHAFEDGRLAIQPRTVARTHLIEHNFVLVDGLPSSVAAAESAENREDVSPPASPGKNSSKRDAEELWWRPLRNMRFDDPEQDAPAYRWRNHVRAQMPLPGVWLTAYAGEARGRCGVFLAGIERHLASALRKLHEDDSQILSELPAGSRGGSTDSESETYWINRENADFADADEQRQWLQETLNSYVNVIRPRLASTIS